MLLATTADRRLNVLDVPSCTLRDSLVTLQDSPILSCAVLKNSHILTGAMSGRLAIGDLRGNALSERRDHGKYVVHIALHETGGTTTWVATAGWDAKICLYNLDYEEGETPRIDDPFDVITLQTNPEAILFVDHPENGKPVLIVTRRDSTHLYYYSIESEARLIGKQNIAPRERTTYPSFMLIRRH